MSDSTRGQSTFDEAATRLVHGLSSQEPGAVLREDFAAVVAWLAHWLSRRYGLSDTDAEDTAVEAIEKVHEASPPNPRGGQSIENPVGYLVTTARHAAIDKLRREQKRSGRQDPWENAANVRTDDAVAALLDREATAAAVHGAMRTAAKRGDHRAVRVVGIWLSLVETTGTEPSSREVGERAGVSHTAVQQILQRFRSYFP